jgi:hypothetical protein
MMKLKVEGNPNLVKDMRTGAIINIDRNSVKDAKLLKSKMAKKEEEIETLKNDVAEIKSILNKLIEKL